MIQTILSIWKGEESLFKTFWLYGAGGNILFSIILHTIRNKIKIMSASINLLEFDFTDISSPLVKIGLLAAAIYIIATLYIVFSYTAIWRSSNNYKGNKSWAYLAKAGLLLGAFDILIDF